MDRPTKGQPSVIRESIGRKVEWLTLLKTNCGSWPRGCGHAATPIFSRFHPKRVRIWGAALTTPLSQSSVRFSSHLQRGLMSKSMD
jgi:hypothetical protein